MNCDRIARAYRWLEYFAFGTALERCRTHFLSSIIRQKHALLLGDGDGRFLARYLRANPAGQADSVEVSPKMQALARNRAAAVPGGLERVRFILSDAHTIRPRTAYDLFVTHFFLDCFREDEIDALAVHLCQAALPQTLWLISEFGIPSGPVTRPIGVALIRTMYQFFGRVTGLQTRRLPDHRSVLEGRGFQLQKEHRRLCGLLVSELWGIRTAAGGPAPKV
jgi:SAM-dependent methyltransferase